MRNRLVNPMLCLVAMLFLLPCPVPSAWMEVAESSAVSSQNTVGVARSLGPSGLDRGCYVADVLGEDSHVSSQPDSVASTTVPNDEYFDKQWALTKLQALEAWRSTSGGQDILIAVLDTGIDQAHEDLVGKVAASMNFTDSPTASDLHGHGTHIAGIIAAATNNGIGIAGVAPHCRLLNVKVAEDSGMVSPSTIAKGIVWAVDNGAKVINMSFTLSEPAQTVEDAVNYAWSKGAVVVAASGNCEAKTREYPAHYSNCIAVTATDASDSVVFWSNHEDWIDVAAPGISIYSTLPGDSYAYKDGTSVATAYVAGVAGLLFPRVPNVNGNGLLNGEVRRVIESDCGEIGILGLVTRAEHRRMHQ